MVPNGGLPVSSLLSFSGEGQGVDWDEFRGQFQIAYTTTLSETFSGPGFCAAELGQASSPTASENRRRQAVPLRCLCSRNSLRTWRETTW